MHAFCTYCSRSKSRESGEIPAVQRYQSSRIQRVFGAASNLGLDFYILSGEFGLMPPDKLIPWYDHLLKPEEVDDLVELMTRQIREYEITSLVYFTEPLTSDGRLLPYRDALVAACNRTSRPFLVIEAELGNGIVSK